MDKKGILTFLAVTVALSVILQGIVFATHVQALLVILLVIPALGAWAGRRVSPWAGEVRSTVWPVPKLPVLRIALVTPLLFALTFFLTTLTGLTRADWRMGELMIHIAMDAGNSAAKAASMPGMPVVMFVLGVLFTTLLAPTLVAAALLGVEYGWRGYLLPRLMPLGRWRAYAVGGVMWGLSMAPSYLTGYPHSALALLALLLAVYIVVSAILGEIWTRTHHIGLTAVFCGCFTAHASGMWPYLFPESLTLFPWGGSRGVVSIAVWMIVAAAPTFFFGKLGVQTKPEHVTPDR